MYRPVAYLEGWTILAGRAARLVAAAAHATVPFAVTVARAVAIVAARWTVTHWPVAHRTARSASCLLQSRWHDLAWQRQVLAQVVDTGVGEVPVVVSPRETLNDQLPGLEGLHELDDLKVWHIYLRMLRQVVVLLRVQHALLEKSPRERALCAGAATARPSLPELAGRATNSSRSRGRTLLRLLLRAAGAAGAAAGMMLLMVGERGSRPWHEGDRAPPAGRPGGGKDRTKTHAHSPRAPAPANRRRRRRAPSPTTSLGPPGPGPAGAATAAGRQPSGAS
eukprot:scaffold1068_cov375-Prasinococcus_capsulatus_cf.AAC.4